ncbi:hypothetical protein M2S00_06815 [Apilactobacillus sp. TMW 2.2459]|uniref:hypothetical protein n=1 Tax=Apilactobacillus xinyiensis TaxID=2841032 RepID=UPI00200FBE10|nr:hypothetical protein [Apilactobacillus xinyiensis]MCL0312816.1 hypothetical protein [Apilactobacillus xinyiensis]
MNKELKKLQHGLKINPDEIVVKIGNVKAEKYTGEGSHMIADALKHVKDEKEKQL